MQTYTRYIILLVSLLCFKSLLFAQDEPRPVISSTSLGAGSSYIYDTYLSPLVYKGYNVQLNHERIVGIPRWHKHMYFQQQLKLNFSNGNNLAHNNNTMAGIISYEGGVIRKLNKSGKVNFFAGGSGSAELGFIYNSRNGNNPATAKAMINLNANLMATYTLRLGTYPVFMRAQASTPFLGVFFSPQFGQSYYEIFGLGNSKGVVKFGSFHNQQAINSLVTMDFPVGSVAIRIGYYLNFYKTEANYITTKMITNNFMLGVTKEFRLIPPKASKKSGIYN